MESKKRLVYAEDVLENIDRDRAYMTDVGRIHARAAVNAAPTVDAVEVVRCGKCIHAAESISVPCKYVCNREGSPCYKRIAYADFGCLYGERRTDNER